MMIKSIRFFVLILVHTICFVTYTISQSYQFIQIEEVAQACHPNLEKLFFDSKGRLWLTSNGGGVCTVGSKLSSTLNEKNETFPGYFIDDIHEDKDGKIWILSENGPFAFDGFEWKKYHFSELTGECRLIRLDDGNIGINDHQYIYKWVDSENQQNWKLEQQLDQSVRRSYEIDESHLACFTDSKILLIHKSAQLWDKDLPISFDVSNILSVCGNSQKLFIANKENVYLVSPNQVKRIAELPEYTINDLIYDGSAYLWLGTEYHGLVQFDLNDKTFKEFDVSKDGKPNRVLDVAFDADANVWVIADQQGVLKHVGEQFKYLSAPDGSTRSIYQLKIDYEDFLWVINTDGKLWTQNGASNSLLSDRLSLNGKHIIDLALLNQSKQLLLSRDGTIMLHDFDGDTITQIYQLDPTLNWMSFKPDKLQNIWALSQSDLVKIKLQFLPTFPFVKLDDEKIQWVDRNHIKRVHIDKKNRLWWMEENRIGYYFDGLVSIVNGPRFFKKLSNWFEDEQGYLWIGTSGAGLYYVDLYSSDPVVKILELPNSKNWPNILNILVDYNEVFLTTTNKLLNLKIDRFNNKVLSWEEIRYAEGFDQIEFKPATLVKNRFDEIFIGTQEGVLQLKAKDSYVETPRSLPFVTIDKIEVELKNIYDTEYAEKLLPWNQQSEPIKLRPNQNDIQFYFSSPNLSGSDIQKYRWRLKGSDHNWSELIDNTNVFFSNLPPGAYTFEVRSCATNGVCADSISSFQFIIQAPIYKRGWFILTTVFILGGVGILFLLRRNRKIRMKYSEIQERLKLENKALDLERKSLQLQMNPHFIFNAMNTIQSEIKTESISKAKSHLAKFSRLMRQVLESSRQNTVSIEDEIELLQNYISIACLSKGIDIDLKIDVENNLDVDSIEIPSMILQPFVENAIKHGFKGLDQGTIEIDFALLGKNLTVSISDDGLGFDPMQNGGHHSVALEVIQERLKMMARPGFFDIHLKDPSAIKRKGTKVFIKLPLEES